MEGLSDSALPIGHVVNSNYETIAARCIYLLKWKFVRAPHAGKGNG
jgi:hypothetical protein